MVFLGACAREFALPPPKAGPVLREVVPAGGFAGDRVSLRGERLFGPGLGEPRVSFPGATARVVAASPDRVEVEVPRGTFNGPVFLRTAAGEARAPEEFVYFGRGHLLEAAEVRRPSLVPFFLPEPIVVDGASGRVAVRLEVADLVAVFHRASGEVRWLTAPRLIDVAPGTGGTFFLLGLDGLVPVDSDDRPGPPLGLPARAGRFGVAPDGTWACVAYDDPYAVGIVDLVSGSAGLPLFLDDEVFVALRIVALEGPPRGCLLTYVSTTDPVLESAVAEFRREPLGLSRVREYRFPGFAGDSAFSPAEGALYLRFTLPRQIARLDLGSGEMRTQALPRLRMSGLLLGPGPDRLLVGEFANGQVVELARPSLEPTRVFSVGGSPRSLGTIEEAGEIVVADASPLRLLFADAETGALRGERPLALRASAVAASLDLGQFVMALDGSAAIVPYAWAQNRFVTEATVDAAGAVRRLAATVPAGKYLAAAVDAPGGPALSLFLMTSEMRGAMTIVVAGPRLDAPLAGPAEGLAIAECAPPRPCPFGPAGAVVATVPSAGALYFAAGDALRDAAPGASWLSEAHPGLGGPGACVLSDHEPMLAVAEEDPPGIAFLDFAGAPAVRARAALPAAPSRVEWVPRARSVLALAAGRLFRASLGERDAAVREIALPAPASALAVSPDGVEVYVGSAARPEVVAIELATDRQRVLATPAPPAALATDATGEVMAAIRADTGALFILE